MRIRTAAVAFVVCLATGLGAQDLRDKYGTRSLEAAKLIDEGIKLMQAQRPADAVPKLKKAAEVDPQCHMTYLWLGSGLQDLGEIDAALAVYQKLIDVSPRGRVTNITIEGTINCGNMLGKIGRLDESCAWLSKAVFLDPSDSYELQWKAYRNLSISLRDRKVPLSAAMSALMAYMANPQKVERVLVEDLLKAAEAQKEEAAQVLTLTADAAPPAARKTPSKIAPAALEGVEGVTWRLVLDAARGRVLAFGDTKAAHYFSIPAATNKPAKVAAPGPVHAATVVGDALYLSVADPPRLVQVGPDGAAVKTWALQCAPPASLAVSPACRLAAFPVQNVLHTFDLDTGALAATKFGASGVESDPLQHFCYAYVRPDPQVGHIIIDGRPVTFSLNDDEWMQSTLYRFAIAEKKLLLTSVRLNAASNAQRLHVSPDGHWATLVGGGGWRPDNPGPHKAGYGMAVMPSSNFTTVHGFYASDHYPLAAAVNPVTGQIAVVRETDARVYSLAAPTEAPVVLAGPWHGPCAWSADGRSLYIAAKAGGVKSFTNELTKEEEAGAGAWQKDLAARVAKLSGPAIVAAAVDPIKDLANFKILSTKADVVKAIQKAEKQGRTTKPPDWPAHAPYMKDPELASALRTALAAVERRDYGVASYQLKQLQPKHPNHPVIEQLLGTCYYFTKQNDKCEPSMLAAIKADQGMTNVTMEALRCLGALKGEKGDAMSAAYCYATVLLVDSADPTAKEEAAGYFKRAGLEAEAKKLLEKGAGAAAPSKKLPILPVVPAGPVMKATDLYRKAAPSVVRIDAHGKGGSGVCVGQKGYILTNAHVVAGEDFVDVYAYAYEGGKLTRQKPVKADVIFLADAQDVAVLRIESPPASLEPVAVADRDPQAAEKVYAIGSPGLGGQVLDQSISEGMVSSPSRQVGGQEYLQHSAAVNPGNSGGPVLDEKGQVIGLVTLKAGLEGVSFAIPAKVIRAVFARGK